MCGIAGILLGADAADPHRLAAIDGMVGALRHRGPDGDGTWLDPAAGVALGHRRLAILDLSAAGRQPMLSASGRLVLSFNGEIYNFAELRTELEASGERFRGHSDTEVLLAAIERWGLMAALRRAVGMFALAVWDRQRRMLHLARDRLGKKPLYLALHRGALLFASELKALHAIPGFSPTLDRGAVALYLRYAYVPDPYCIYEQALKLPAGTLVTVRAEEVGALDAAALLRRVERYWALAEIVDAGRREPLHLSERAAVDAFEDVLRRAVGERMVADVPLGAFLSGGIDSSTVVALMQAQSDQPVRTFTIGFEKETFDEANDARRVAAHLGTDHVELHVTAADALDVIPDLPAIYDEPFADASQIPTFLVSRLARRHLTVALTGDGGDEVCGGYSRYLEARRLAALYRLPLWARKAARHALTSIPPDGWNHLLQLCRPGLPSAVSRAADGERIHKLASFIALPDFIAMYKRAVSTWVDPAQLVHGAPEPPTAVSEFDWYGVAAPDTISQMMYLDTMSYLPGDILVKVDRASMATSLEVRSPLLDHRVVELAWRLPSELKLRNGHGKWILREVLARYLPRPLFERPKQGFGPPIGAWLRGPLRPWAEDLLAETRLRREGLLEPGPIRQAWEDHRSGRWSRSFELWNVLMLQAWQARWHDLARGEREAT